MTASQETLNLLKGMLNLPLYVVLRHPLDLSKLPDLLHDHLKWAIAAEKNGELFASGPFMKDESPPGSLGGMSIVRANDLLHAESIIQKDPFISNGVYAVTIQKWLLMEGSFDVHVTLSNKHVDYK
jgi:uncharacterized protein